MIRKPSADWQGGTTPLSETIDGAASAARHGRDVAAIGIRAVGAGMHTARGLVCWGVALFWGAIAIAMVPLGEFPTAIGVGLMALAAAWGGKRAFERAGVGRIGRRPPTRAIDADADADGAAPRPIDLPARDAAWDPDAIVTRYLAQKQALETQTRAIEASPMAGPSSFGRKVA